MSIVYLALGTNLGDRLANLRAALDALSRSTPHAQSIIIHRQSSIYETPPWGYTDQPAFLNMTVKAETKLPPLELLSYLKNLEIQIGREKSFHWGPRLIDLDILFYDDLILESESLTIPHPRLYERAFVLVPLADIAADFTHPVFQKTIAELLSTVERAGILLFN